MRIEKTIEGNLIAEGKKVAIVASRFNEFIVDKLLGGAQDAFVRHLGNAQDLTLVWVPGAYEIPLLAKKLASSGKYHSVVCLGAVIRGSTPHFEYVSSEVSKGVAQSSWDTGVPIIFGVLTTDTIEQAIERAGTKAGNKGYEAMMAAIEMANLMDKLS